MGRTSDPPLIAGMVHGLRTWTLAIRAGEVSLVSGYEPAFAWKKDGRPTEAECGSGHRGCRPENIPHEHCGCGLYALHPRAGALEELFRAESNLESQGTCGGIVEAWGRVRVHRDGFRALYARPKTMILPARARGTDYEVTVRRVAQQHGAEVAVIRDAQDLERYCQERELGLGAPAVARLLPAEEDETESAPSLPSRPEPPARLRRLGSLAGSGVLGLLALLWYGTLGIGAVSLVIALLQSPSGGDQGAHHGASGPPLKTLDTRLGPHRGGILYVTRVRNTSETDAAVGVRLDGTLVDPSGETLADLSDPKTDQLEPTIPPGATGAVVGWIERTPARNARMGAGVAALALRHEVARARSAEEAPGIPALLFSDPSFDPVSCVITAVVRSTRVFPAARVQLLGFHGSVPTGVIGGEAGPLGPQRVRQALVRLAPSDCAAGADQNRRFEVYPDLARGQIPRAGQE